MNPDNTTSCTLCGQGGFTKLEDARRHIRDCERRQPEFPITPPNLPKCPRCLELVSVLQTIQTERLAPGSHLYQLASEAIKRATGTGQ